MNNELFGERPERYTLWFVLIWIHIGDLMICKAAVSSKFALSACFEATVDRVSENDPMFSYEPLLQVLLHSKKPSLFQLSSY